MRQTVMFFLNFKSPNFGAANIKTDSAFRGVNRG